MALLQSSLARGRRVLGLNGGIALLCLLPWGWVCAAPLHQAVHAERLAETRELLAAGADANATNAYGLTPLALACSNGNATLVASLLDAAALPDVADGHGVRPLMLAARAGQAAVLELLLEAGADPNARDKKGQTALMWAAAEGHGAALSILLKAGAEREAKLHSGFTAMFFAARQGHASVVDLLLADGADPNAPLVSKVKGGRAPSNGSSALTLAIENGHFELALKLLEAGADASDMRSGHSPLHILTWVRKPKRGDGINGAPPPRGSGKVSSLEFAELLITEYGVEVDAQLKGGSSEGKSLSKKGATAFLFAARTADLPLMKLLVKLGADPALPNAQGRTPLLAAAGVALGPEADEAASEDEAVQAVRYLLDLGAEFDVVDDFGDTVMHAAAYKQSPMLVQLLADQGADPDIWNQKNAQGWTPLLIAQGFRHGNYKPSAPTIAALTDVMRAAGVTIPPPPLPPGAEKREDYE